VTEVAQFLAAGGQRQQVRDLAGGGSDADRSEADHRLGLQPTFPPTEGGSWMVSAMPLPPSLLSFKSLRRQMRERWCLSGVMQSLAFAWVVIFLSTFLSPILMCDLWWVCGFALPFCSVPCRGLGWE